MLRIFALFVGIGLMVLGLCGFFSYLAPHGKLFALFRVNLEHNVLLLTTGLLGILCGLCSGFISKLYLFLVGCLYLFLAALGFYTGDAMLLQMVAVNRPDNYLHLAVALLCLTAACALRR